MSTASLPRAFCATSAHITCRAIRSQVVATQRFNQPRFAAAALQLLLACPAPTLGFRSASQRLAVVRARRAAHSRLTAARMSSAGSSSSSLADLLGRIDNSLKRRLSRDPRSESEFPNQQSRESFGHYVEVRPTALPDPVFVAASHNLAAEIGLDPAEFETADFVRLFSGDVEPLLRTVERGVGANESTTPQAPWATPYAVSVFGHPIWAPDPFGRGCGYGAGRAL